MWMLAVASAMPTFDIAKKRGCLKKVQTSPDLCSWASRDQNNQIQGRVIVVCNCLLAGRPVA